MAQKKLSKPSVGSDTVQCGPGCCFGSNTGCGKCSTGTGKCGGFLSSDSRRFLGRTETRKTYCRKRSGTTAK